MVNKESSRLDILFSALSDPTRRSILAQLEEDTRVSASRLAEPFAMGLPAVMKHLGILADAGLIQREKRGRTVEVSLSAAPLLEAVSWLQRYEHFWSGKLDR